MVPFLDLKSVNLADAQALGTAFHRVLDSGWYVLGREVESFEAEYASYCGARHAIGVANGLDALTLALKAMGIGPGDEVIVPSNTYIATWLAVTHVGARVVPVEPDRSSFNLDPSRVQAAITPRTRAILPVHLYGRPADLDPLIELARRTGLRVLEDGAQAHGARYKGRRLGAHGDAVAWSFYPGKNLGALGDAGAVTTDDDGIADRLRVLRNYGSRIKYHNEIVGFNSRLDELQAAFLRAKLPGLEAANERRRSIATAYLDGMRSLVSHGLGLPAVSEVAESAWHLFVVRHARRDALATLLKEAGVATMIHYPIPPHLQPAYADFGWARGAFPVAEAMHDEVLSLPIGPTQSADQTGAVIDAVCQAVRALASA